MSDRVVIIGAGIAGMNAAITLAKQGVRSLLIASMPSQRAQSVMAAGGINAALDTMGEGDSPSLHAEETLKAGRYLADTTAVKNLTEAAPELIYELQRYGMSFTLTSFDEKKIRLRPFGGQTKKRTAYADTLTGRQLINTLAAVLRKYEIDGVCERMCDRFFVGISKDKEGKANGVFIYSRSEGEVTFIPARAVIICCGGLNGLFGNCTGSVMNSGAAAAGLFMSGIEMANLEMIQYHPTTVRLFAKNMLISEAARGEGGRLFVEKDGHPYYFMEEKYPGLGNLMPRDVVSKEEYALIKKGYKVYLDLRGLEPSVYKKKLKGVVLDCQEFMHLDVSKEPIPVEPGIHFFMGGIKVDVSHRSSICGVYAAGECACQYHGANRLGGNSTLGALYGGRIAAETVIADFNTLSVDETEGVRPSLPEKPTELIYNDEKLKLQDTMRKALGIERNEDTLNSSIAYVSELIERTQYGVDRAVFFDEAIGWSAECMLSLAMLESARLRRESRGAHFRSDYPTENEQYRKNTVSYLRNGEIITELRSVGE